MENNHTSKTGTVDGGLTVFMAGRDFCLMEMVREACTQYAENKCTLDEFMDMYEAVMFAATDDEGRRCGWKEVSL